MPSEASIARIRALAAARDKWLILALLVLLPVALLALLLLVLEPVAYGLLAVMAVLLRCLDLLR